MSYRKYLYVGPYFECEPVNGVTPYDTVGDYLHQVGYGPNIYLVPNIKRAGDPAPKIDGDYEAHLDLRNVDMAKDMAWLQKAFQKELKDLENAYGSVSIKWGVHQYFM